MSEYKSTAEHAKELRTYLKKEHGLTSRAVSVRSSNFANGSSISITIKCPTVSVATVEAAAAEHERIDRCEMTGDILSGCNRYVSVRFSHEVEEFFRGEHEEACEKAMMELAANPESATHVHVEGTESTMSNGGGKFFFEMWHGGEHGRSVCSAREASFEIASRAPKV